MLLTKIVNFGVHIREEKNIAFRFQDDHADLGNCS